MQLYTGTIGIVNEQKKKNKHKTISKWVCTSHLDHMRV